MAESDRIGRNALCPCGSGDKFKRCHGRTAGSTVVPVIKHMEDAGESPACWVITNLANTSFFVDKQGRVLLFSDKQTAVSIVRMDLFASQGPTEIRVAGVGPTKLQLLKERLPFLEVPNFETAAALIEERVRDQREKLDYETIPPDAAVV